MASIQSQVTGVLEEVDFVEASRSKRATSSPRSTRVYTRRLWRRRKDNWPRTPPFMPKRSPISRAFKHWQAPSIALQQVADQQFLVAQDAAAMETDQGVIKSDQTQLDYTTLRACSSMA